MLNSRFSTYVCYLINAVAAALMTVIGPMLSRIADEFSLTLSQSGLLYTAEFVGFTILIILAGILADKIGKRAVLTVVLAALIVSLYIFSIVQSFGAALAVMFFAGGCCGPLSSVTIAIITDLNPVTPDKNINVQAIYYGLGAMIGPVIAGICLTYDISWRVVYFGLAITCAVLLLISFMIKIPKTHTSSRISLKAVRKIAKDWRFLLVCLCLFLYGGAEASAWGWMSEYMKVNLGFAVLKSSFSIGVFWLSMTIGRIIILPLIKKIGSRAMIGILAAGAAVATFISAFVSSEVFAWTVTVLMGLFYSGQYGIMLGQAGKRHKEYSGTSFAFLISSGGLAMAIIPALLGVVSENFGVFIAQMLPAFLLVIVLFIYCFIAKPETGQ